MVQSTINFLNSNLGAGIAVALLTWLIARYRGAVARINNKINLLEAIKKEIDWNRGYFLPLIEDDTKELHLFFDPTRANFKCGNDVISYAVTNGIGILNSNTNLVTGLVTLNDCIRQYNQQVQEQHDCRFGSPELTAMATRLAINEKILVQWMSDVNSRPDEIRDLLEEIRLRNWAINTRIRSRFRPVLIEVSDLLNTEIDRTKKTWWRVR